MTSTPLSRVPRNPRSHTVHLCDARPVSGAGCALYLCVRALPISTGDDCSIYLLDEELFFTAGYRSHTLTLVSSHSGVFTPQAHCARGAHPPGVRVALLGHELPHAPARPLPPAAPRIRRDAARAQARRGARVPPRPHGGGAGRARSAGVPLRLQLHRYLTFLFPTHAHAHAHVHVQRKVGR